MDPMKIRFHKYDPMSGTPSVALRRVQSMTLRDMLTVGHQHLSEVLFYEKLDFTISELENKKALRIIWLDKENREVASRLMKCIYLQLM